MALGNKAFIFDIDGTLADLKHRLHHITNGSRDWDGFFAGVPNDGIIPDTRRLLLIAHDAGYKIILVSGRTDKVRAETVDWLAKHEVPYHEIHMRVEGDYRQDTIIKSEILDRLLEQGNEIIAVVDDRPSVVAMWRERGLLCLQCADWEESHNTASMGLLTIMIGTTGAGKTTWLKSDAALEMGIHPSHIINSDQLRADLCGDFRDQTKNDAVFSAMHAVAKERLKHGLPTVLDATHLRRKDRLESVSLANGHKVRYILLDRPSDEKRRDGGWRNELGFDLITKHEQTLGSQIKDILNGDKLPNVEVLDLRRAA